VAKDDLLIRMAFERWRSGQHLEGDNAEAIQIGAFVDRALGRQVGWRPKKRRCTGKAG
jgi:hypothetical protein